MAFDKQLNKVDFPTLGNPTIPAFITKQFYEIHISSKFSFASS
ncbi:hypothetical protein JCM19294_1097 [Nonlabens tegetincola]|uniref:Uncharacterized protein n=1 Tax=Nonlabens tegetincola TaxID=323273 RepID=A0A090Q4V9_9FLAO|nr:hypothetical protein JCM19294_1097 [Nonlabens tegetincola]